ncbi:hypothetical protein F5Y18DRAFT_372018 [Xylariaceae sp. FL1019]|nr:hypothetical protein F5Y18DRAFT_372018 [Xylariaceae sp. FL1019]
MKVVITGATGFVGSEVVRQAIASDKVTQALVLTRKPLPDEFTKSEKIKVFTIKDFSASYSEDLLEQLSGAEACIWAIGGRAPQFADVETARKVSVDYTLNAANAFVTHLAGNLPASQKFRFVFCSGKFAEWDDNKSLVFMSDTRHIKGQVEKALCSLADDNKDKLEVFIARPGGILPTGGNRFKDVAARSVGFILVDHLARDFIRLATEGHSQRIVEAGELIKM